MGSRVSSVEQRSNPVWRFALRSTAANAALALALLPQTAWAERQVTISESTLQQALDELRLLRAEVATLRARVDAGERTQTSTQAQAATQAAAQAVQAAQAAQAQATAVQAQLTQTQTQLAQAQAAVPKAAAAKDAKPGWWEKTRVGGRAFINFSHFRRRSDGVTTDNNTGLQVKRLYLTVDHTFDKTWSMNITADIDNVLGNKDGSPTGRGFYVKNAYAQAQLDPRLFIRAGAAPLPWIPYIDNLTGLRYIEQSLTDRTKFGTSADWGLHAGGEFDEGLVSYAVSVVNGAGYRDLKTSQTVDVAGRVSLKYKGINAAVGGYSGRLGKNTKDVNARHRANRFNALLAYKDERFMVGGEYFYSWNWTQVTAIPSDRGTGYSAFASVKFAKRWSVFGRYDWLRPRKRTKHNFTSNYMNAGIQFNVIKPIDIALVYKHARSRNGTLSTGDGPIGGIKHGNFNEVGMYGQFKF